MINHEHNTICKNDSVCKLGSEEQEPNGSN